ncbi:MAG: FKBP-type peptidyl-prolyl cis-trans isomerase [Verrucomicrobiota bacterium]
MKISPLTPLFTAAVMVAMPTLARSEETPTAKAPAADAAKPETKMPETPADVAAAPADAVKTKTGLASKVLQAGTGDKKPTASDEVTVHYSGWTTDGKMFDSSMKRGEPATFPLGQVIAGWTEGLQLMVAGEKRRFWIPEDLAYGPVVPGSGRPGGMLCFDVELISIKEAPKPPADTKQTAGGVAYKIIKEGAGEKPASDQVITFHFSAKTMEGEVMQDSHKESSAPTAPLDKLPKELGELFADMKAGEVRQCWLPESRIPGGFVVADLELISFKAAPPAPEVPKDVAAAPADALKTESGIAHKVITEGKGKDKPKAEDTVKVHYSGWTTDGKMFDSSITRGEPTSFGLNQVIKGWTEGVQLMVVGEKRRFWIPEGLAYGPVVPGSDRPGGMLVFDIELLEIGK